MSWAALSRRLPNFEARPQQRRMASAVARAIDEDGVLAVEAGTGCGKSFAYLLPALRAVKQGKRVVVSTRTKALQAQLAEQDIPLLVDALKLGGVVTAHRAVGNGNYVCRLRLETEWASRIGDDEPNRVMAWVRDGGLSLMELAPPTPAPFAASIRVDPAACTRDECPHFGTCGWLKAKREREASNLLVVNHALLLTDLQRRAKGGRVLPDYDVLIVDEAHDLPASAMDALGASFERIGVEKQVERAVEMGVAADIVRSVREEVGRVFDMADKLLGDRRNVSVSEWPFGGAGRAHQSLMSLAAECDTGIRNDAERSVRWRSLKASVERHADALSSVVAFGSRTVRWAERGRKGGTVLRMAPVDTGRLLARSLYGLPSAVVFTSATIATGESFRPFLRDVGAYTADTLQLGSPFDYEKNCELRLYPDAPCPKRNAEAYAAHVEEAARDLVLESEGGAFLLFTSWTAMRAASAALRPVFEKAGLHVVCQGQDTHADIVRTFGERDDAVLFGTESYWAGVDVPGRALRLVVLAKLPFDLPSHPVELARTRLLEAAGRDAFREVQLPKAITRLRQGHGRLIRRADDVGTVAILDPRICTKRYGAAMLRALPEASRSVAART